MEVAKAVQWGSQHEKAALNAFTEATGLSVQTTGLHLHPCGCLGAPPDGIVDEKSIIEVKCPYRYREKSLSEALRNETSYIVYENDYGDTIINKTHDYYHQKQGQLYLCDKNLCHLVVWAPQEACIV